MRKKINKKCICGLCGKKASCEWLYHQPGDIDSDNLVSLIYLCIKHRRNYSNADYPEPRRSKDVRTTDGMIETIGKYLNNKKETNKKNDLPNCKK